MLDLRPSDSYRVFDFPDAENLNPVLLNEFLACEQDESVKRTHFFAGRFENIYPGLQRTPSVKSILDFAAHCGAEWLGIDPSRFERGFWFNAMYPGHVTNPHHHDELDEMLSAAYYIVVPERSGDLLLRLSQGVETVVPRPGRLVMFPPDMTHEVTRHEGEGLRLSIGINLGLPED